MKRHLFFVGLFLTLNYLPCESPAQDSPAALAEAQRQEAEDRHKRMTTKIEDLEATIQSYQKSLQAVREELRTLREEVARANNNQASQETLKQLAENIKEVDRKRIADNEKVLNELSKALTRIERSLSGKQPSAGRQPPPKPLPSPLGSEKGYEYAIREGDTLGGIVEALRAQGVMVTRKQVQDTNPNVNWSKLQIGQKIFIPAPAQP